jgi:hypothetical protein
VAGLVKAQDERGQTVDPRELERKAMGKAAFKVESATVSTAQRIQIRKLLQKVGISAKQGEELLSMSSFLQKMQELAESAGGDAPKPARPDTISLDDIRRTGGNEQLLALYNRYDELSQNIGLWMDLTARIQERLPGWITLKRLTAHAAGIQDADVIIAQAKYIEEQRQLLEEPDLVAPLLNNVTQLLRDELNRLKSSFDSNWYDGEEKLKADHNWGKLDPEQRHELRSAQSLTQSAIPEVNVESADAVLKTLDVLPVSAFRDRVAAMAGRYSEMLLAAAQLLEPKAKRAEMPSATLRTEADVDEWAAKVVPLLKEQLSGGPVLV